MTAEILDGRRLAAEIRADLKHRAEVAQQNGQRPPGLAVIIVGDDPASKVYVRNKHIACREVGFHSQLQELPSTTTQQELLDVIDGLNNDSEIDGILMQLPLPEQLNSQDLLEKIAVDKDVDCFHPYNLGRLAQRHPLLRPCTPYGIMKLLAKTGQPLVGAEALVVGASNIVGRPMVLELEDTAAGTIWRKR